jgi:two-component system chemotaxis response regulator CheY
VIAKCILIVDDSETVRQVLQLALGNAGYQVVEAEDGFDALAKLSGAQIDMLITDLNMPNMDGLELIKKVREEGKHRFTPIVMLTTESSEEKKKAGREAGASGWIVKPFKPEQLLKVVKMVLGE